MGVDYVIDIEQERSCMYCNTTQRAFGPVFEGPDHTNALVAFVTALPDDPRAFSDEKLAEMAEAFVRAMNEEDDAAAREAQAAREAAADMIETQPAPPPVIPTAPTDEPPPPQPADTDTVTPAPEAAPVTVTEPPAAPIETRQPGAPEVPYGRRVCWNCNGSGREFVGQAEATCGICDGVGHLPAA